MEIKEIRLEDLDVDAFIERKIDEIAATIRGDLAISALSGGVDSSVVTILGHKALGKKLKTYFIDNGLMRKKEPKQVAAIFKKMGIEVEIINARDTFLYALKGLTDSEEKREAITRSFYKDIFAHLVRIGDASLLQGTNYTDIEETVAGIKRQHNVLEQLGIDPQKQYGYTVIEPLIQLRKPAIREVARVLGLPNAISERKPFPGPGLATRIGGEITSEKVEVVRQATAIVEEELFLAASGAFQYMATLCEGKVTGIYLGRRKLGWHIEIRCWDSQDAVIATPTKLRYDFLFELSRRITTEVSGVVHVSYGISPKPPSTIEPI